jgi:tetratricopeptide (TPR) repeat protein
VRRPRNEAALAAELEALAESALDLGLSEHARLGFHLLAYLRWETGGAEDANRFMMRAELVSRAGGEEQRILAMAEAARCLAILDRDLPRAEALALEAGALGRRAGVEPVAVPDALGILRLQQGRIADARTHFGRALELARASRDRLGEFTATEHLVMTEIEDGRHARAGQLAAGLVIIARKLREGSEAPFADALAALSRYLSGDETAREALDVAIADLRSADAKQRLIYVLTRAAGAELTRGLHASAARRAAEALRCAELLERPSDVERARALLVAAERRS